MQRRAVALALCSLTVVPSLLTAKAAARGPLFWLAKRGNARVFLLGISDAKDRSWFTPTIQAAFEQSSTLWEEIAPPPSLEHVNQLYEQYGLIRSERSSTRSTRRCGREPSVTWPSWVSTGNPSST